MKLQRRSLCAVLVVPALIAAGCSSTENKNDYVDQINEAQQEFVDSTREVTSTNPDTPKAFADSLAKLETEAKDSADRIDAIEPPEEVEGTHRMLVQPLRDLAASSAKLQQSLEGGSTDVGSLVDAQTTFTKELTEQQQAFTRAIDEVNRKLQE